MGGAAWVLPARITWLRCVQTAEAPGSATADFRGRSIARERNVTTGYRGHSRTHAAPPFIRSLFMAGEGMHGRFHAIGRPLFPPAATTEGRSTRPPPGPPSQRAGERSVERSETPATRGGRGRTAGRRRGTDRGGITCRCYRTHHATMTVIRFAWRHRTFDALVSTDRSLA